jgi:tripartite ATP-independent transporter DctM subunit
MLKHKYDKMLAAGSVAAGACLGMLIPPSALAVIYGILTGVSIGRLLLGGVGPGLLLAMLWSVAVYIRVWRDPTLAPSMAKGEINWENRWSSLKGMWAVAIIAAVVIGGIYTGIFTATEAAAVGSLAVLVLYLVRRKFSWGHLQEALLETGKISCMIFLIFIGATLLSRLMAASGISTEMASAIANSGLPPVGILAMIIVLYLILGCFLDSTSIMALTLPVLLPLFPMMGYHEIWLGQMLIVTIEMGLLTPPVGLNVYVLKAAAGDTLTLEEAFRGVWFYLVVMIAGLIMMYFFPQIVTFLPDTAFGAVSK